MDTRLHLWSGRECRLSFLVTIAIPMMQRLAEAMTNPFDGACSGRDIEGTRSPHCYPPDIGSDLCPFPDNCLDDIAGLVVLDALCLLGFGAWEAVFVHQAELPASMPVGTDSQWHDLVGLEHRWRAAPHAGRIEPMCFGQVPGRAIELR